MGMRSYVSSNDMDLVNEAGLKSYVVECINKKLYGGDLFQVVLGSLVKPEFHKVAESSGLCVDDDFLQAFDIDDWKIISYWYDDFVVLIRDLSAFYDGEIRLEFETGEEFAVIDFDGETTIEVGEVQWRDLAFEDIYDVTASSMRQSKKKSMPVEAELVKRSRLLKQV